MEKKGNLEKKKKKEKKHKPEFLASELFFSHLTLRFMHESK